jgi:hypothetical protein
MSGAEMRIFIVATFRRYFGARNVVQSATVAQNKPDINLHRIGRALSGTLDALSICHSIADGPVSSVDNP